MEDFSFDIDSILTPEEAEQALQNSTEESENSETTEQNPDIDNTENNESQAEEQTEKAPEEVGLEEIETGETSQTDKGGSSPKQFYSSIAAALKNDGVFPEFDDSEIESLDSPEAFAEMISKAEEARLDAVTKRVDEALRNGVAPDSVKKFESTISYLNSITEDALSANDEDGEALRREIMFNDFLRRGYDEDNANRMVERSLSSGNDVDDAKYALAALKAHYEDEYKKTLDDAKNAETQRKAKQKEEVENFKKMTVDSEIEIGGTKLDKRTRQRIYDSVMKPTHKDEATGKLLTPVQQFQKEHPLEFLKQLGMWFVLTDAGKNVNGFVGKQVQVEKNKSIRELERKLNTTSLATDGTLSYMGGRETTGDPLLSDGWKVGWNK